MAGKAKISRIPQRLLKTVTFDGTAGFGAVGTNITIVTITGRVLIRELVMFCTVNLVAPGGTVGMKALAGQTIIAATSTNDIDANDFWIDQTPEPESSLVAGLMKDLQISNDLIIEPLTAAVTAGAFEVSIYWMPLSFDGNLT